MPVGTTTTVVLASRVKISAATGGEMTLTSDVKVRQTRTVDRIETRAGPIDTFRWRLEEIEFTAQLTEDLLSNLQAIDNIDANGLMTFQNWTVAGVDVSGAAGTSDVYSAALIDYEELAPENGTAQVRVKLRIGAVAA